MGIEPTSEGWAASWRRVMTQEGEALRLCRDLDAEWN
jgi:hypothetical protein